MYPNDKPMDLSPPGTGYTTTVRNNIIVNTLERKNDSQGTGYGVINYLSESHTFVLQNNCFYNNEAGVCLNATSINDIYADPHFADQERHDYHLKSLGGRWNGKTWVKDHITSPCIDAGYPFSDYSNEPEDNGARINIGRYGNTEEASRSGVMPEYQALWNQVPPSGLKMLKILIRIPFFI